MPTFDYRADDAQGRRCKGRLEADGPRHARQLMRERGLWPRELNEVRAGGDTGTHPRSARLSAADLALLTLQLSTLVQAGLPLEEALEAVTKQSAKRKVAGLLSVVRSRVMEGHALSTALAQFPKAFPNCSALPSRPVNVPVTWVMCWNNWRLTPRPARRRGRKFRWPWCTR